MDSILLTSTGAESLESLKQEFLGNELARNNETHGAYLRAIHHLFRGWMPERPPTVIPDSMPAIAPPSSQNSIWEQAELLELCGGSVSRILGSDYSAIDALPVRCRPPLPPFMFISRVTKMTAQAERLEPCEIEWEYDFPEDAFYANHQAVPWIIPLESAHTTTLLLCVIRCDVMFGGNSRFRILGSDTVFSECNFKTGDRFTGNMKIRSFVRIQDRLLIYADYRGLNNGQPAFHSQVQFCLIPANEANPSAPSNRRIKPRTQEMKSQSTISKPSPICSKRSFSREEIASLKQGDLAACFGLVSEKRRPGALSSPQLSMIDRVLRVEPEGGADGLGEILAEKEVDASHWVFPLHFENDPVLPGVLYCEGCFQVLKFYAYFCGLHRPFADIDFVCLPNDSTKTRFLGEVRPKRGTLQFSVSITSYSEGTEAGLRANAEIVWENRTVCTIENLTLGLKPRGPAVPDRNWVRDFFSWPTETAALSRSHRDGLTTTSPELTTPSPEQLGSAGFKKAFGIRYAYLAGSMANGIASEELVIAMGQRGFLSSFGAAGLPVERIREAIGRIQAALPQGPYLFNLIYNPADPTSEMACVQLYLEAGVQAIEASAYVELSSALVYYRLAGLREDDAGRPIATNRIIAKVSRIEVARRFLEPAAKRIVQALVEQGLISEKQALLAEQLPVADAITVEADSAGHTDNQALVCAFPLIRNAVEEASRKHGRPIYVGAGGGIGTADAAAAAFLLGADYVVTGSVNQSCVESGASTLLKEMLSKAGMGDVAMAPAGDMFEMGAKVQVLRKGTLFSVRAQKLYDLYTRYSSLEAIPAPEKSQLEQQILGKSIAQVWEETRTFFAKRNPSRLEKAEHDPKLKMALVFRWYLGLSSDWSNSGREDRKQDFQIWCGPAMGAFNDWVRGSYLEQPGNRRIADVAHHIMSGAAHCYRLGLERPLAPEAPEEAKYRIARTDNITTTEAATTGVAQ
ncbi:MAG TPA: PfaD family polyunsaturated fatty acid/polyketide biosynthesis protein [Chthoniobacterales bacterium]|nr:PfaD family polyunsaturated fatty acid/polyketide biosynthesis protein [Chthoniobacterales bacterium]